MNKNKTIGIIIVAAVVTVACVALAGKYLGNPSGGTDVPNVNMPGALTASTSTMPTSTAATGTATSARPTQASSGVTPRAGGGAASVTFQKFYQGASFSFSYPEDWTIFNPAPFSINNFKGAYDASGAIPMGGAEIDVATTTAPGLGVNDIMSTELSSAANVVRSTVAVQGISCLEVRYENTFGTGIGSRNIAVYCLRGIGLWKIYLSYRADDPAAANHVAVLNNVLASFKFLP
jgi:hypothetical protein